MGSTPSCRTINKLTIAGNIIKKDFKRYPVKPRKKNLQTNGKVSGGRFFLRIRPKKKSRAFSGSCVNWQLEVGFFFFFQGIWGKKKRRKGDLWKKDKGMRMRAARAFE